MTTFREELEAIQEKLSNAYDDLPWIGKKLYGLIMTWEESTLKLRLKVCYLALTIDPSDSSFAWNRLHGMLEWRHFQYTTERCRLEGKKQHAEELAMLMKPRQGDRQTFDSVGDVRFFLNKQADHLEDVIQRHADSYRNKDNKLFYWGEKD